MGILRKLPFLLRLYIGRQNSTLILVEMGKFVLLEIIEAGLSSAVFRVSSYLDEGVECSGWLPK